MLLLIALSLLSLNAQTSTGLPPSSELFRTIAALDRDLFEAYNRCDLPKFESFLVPDVEFYHDQGGPSTGSRTVTEAVRNNICGKTIRKRVEGTIQIYPMRSYGALQTGVHRFYPASDPSKPSGEAKFIHLWQNVNGVWKITRIISYDHVPLAK